MHLSSLSYHSTAGGDARYLSPRHDSAASAVSSSTPSVEIGRWQQSSAATSSNNNTQSNIDDIKQVHGAAASASLDPNNAMPEASEGPSAPNRTFRVRQRRLSHPSSSPNRVRVEQEDGEFIKKAFDNLSLTQPVLPPAASSSSSLHRGETTSTTSTLPAESELDSIILSTRPTSGSRASVASTSSHPFSALSSYSGIPYDRASIQSSYPLLSAETSRIPSGTSPPAGRRSHMRSRSSGNNQPSHLTSALLGIEDTAHPAHEERPQDATRPFLPSAETRAPSGPPPSSSFRPFDASYYTSSGWSDPFAESYELPRLRMRRRSTISGYSVNTSDWNSLRRGSLVSLDNHSPTSATYNNNAAYPRSRNSTHSSSVYTTNSHNNNNFNNTSNNNGNSGPTHAGGGGGGYPTAASAYASMTRLQQPPTTSLRWEAWATAYRESLLQHVHSGYNPLSYQQGGGPRWLERHPSISEETSASLLERTNLFHHLRRQFVARAGSRSESNRILVLELCHALEEYEAALGALCRLAQMTSPQTLLNSISSLPSMKNDKSPSSPPSPAVAPIVLPPSPRYRAQPPSFLDKSQLDLLANEVDSLVREIIEAVPAFSYSLSQGNYGPLPFPINNVRTSAASLTIQGYFEILQIVSASQGAVYTRPSLSRDYTLPGPVQPAPMASHNQTTIDFGQEALNMDKWWPARLRADLRDGLLIEAGDDSPQLNLQSISVIPPIPYRQDSTGTEVLSGTYGMPHPSGSEARDVGLQPGNSAGSGRNDQLLEEGRRRWTEYLQGRQ